MLRPRPFFRLLLVSALLGGLGAQAEAGPEPAYQAARASYRALKGDAARRKLRHHWLNVARRFESVAEHYPKSPRAPEALFTAAQLFEDLSRISLLPEDKASAAHTYREMVQRHPRHKLADDAALALAKMELERQGKPEAARRTLQAALRLPRGDRHKELVALLASLPAATTPPVAPRPAVVRHPLPQALHAEGLLPHLRARADAGEPTLAQQLGLKMRRVVIDPGHGGHDSGAVGPDGTKEKDVALAISLKLAAMLREAGLETVLTREEDTFVALEERTRRANAAKGDLFVSIHCNAAASPKLKGVETYSLNVSSDRYAIRLAARENASSEKGMSDLQFILADLATKVNTDESRRLAGRVQSGLMSHLQATRDLGTKEALFYVLLGAKMPAILVEASFLTNPEEEKRLSSRTYQDAVAGSIAEGVRSFLDDRERVARVN